MPSSAVEKVFGAVTGLSESIRFVRKNSKFMWIRQCEPEIYRKTYKFMQISGWFVHRLTGEFKDSVGMVTGIWPMDYRKLAWYP
jgi:sugar (pentulose or hexulose) kinase